MTLLAVTTAGAILAWVGLALGLVVLLAVLALLRGTLRPVREIDAYAGDVLTAGVGIATHLDAVDELQATRALGAAVPGLAVGYLRKLGLAS